MPGLNTIFHPPKTSIVLTTLLCVLCLGLCTLPVEAQSAGRKLWPRGGSVNNPAPEQAAEPAAETQTALQELHTAENCGFLCIIERQKTAIVGSWLGLSSEGNRILITFNSDGNLIASAQGAVSTIPEFGVLTPAHGVWKHLGGRQFGYSAISTNYDINTGAYLGYLKARSVLTLNEAGDQLTGTDKVEIFDPNNNVVFTATGATTFTRIKFEPLN